MKAVTGTWAALLLADPSPCLRMLVLCGLLGRTEEDAEVRELAGLREADPLVADLLREHYNETGEFGVIASNYDTELFGHWWFEGIDWIREALRHLATSEVVELTTASKYIEHHPPTTVLNLPEGSWGAGGTHFVWDNADTRWMWPIIHDAENRMKEAVEAYATAKSTKRHILDQAARELLLLQSSDWPFLVTTGQAREYAIERFRQHVDRFNILLEEVEQRQPNTQLASDLWEKDKIFPEMDFHWFQA